MQHIPIRRGLPADAAELAAFAARTYTETFGADTRPEDLQVYLAASYGLAQQGHVGVDDHGIAHRRIDHTPVSAS